MAMYIWKVHKNNHCSNPFAMCLQPSSQIKVTFCFQFQNHLFSELEDERGSRKSKKRKVFEQIKKSDCEQQLENVWKKVPKRGKGNKIMKEKEANANNLNVQNQRRKIFEQEEMEEAQRRREATADEESEEGKITRKGENTLQNKRKNINNININSCKEDWQHGGNHR